MKQGNRRQTMRVKKRSLTASPLPSIQDRAGRCVSASAPRFSVSILFAQVTKIFIIHDQLNLIPRPRYDARRKSKHVAFAIGMPSNRSLHKPRRLFHGLAANRHLTRFHKGKCIATLLYCGLPPQVFDLSVGSVRAFSGISHVSASRKLWATAH